MRIRSHVFAPFVALVLGSSCGTPPEPEPTPTNTEEPATHVDPETGAKYLVNPNRRVLSADGLADAEQAAEVAAGVTKVTSALRATFTDVDASGSVVVQLVVCDSGAPKTGVVGVACSVDNDFLLVGGGAQDLWSGAGAMLFESRPAANGEWGTGATWVAQSKDHLTAANHVLHAWAVGLKLRKNDGSWMSSTELFANVTYTGVDTETASANPFRSCTVPVGQKMIGGGARSLWHGTGGVGQLLTNSFPNSATSWHAGAKDHLTSNHAKLRVYCIGINDTIPNFGSLLINRKSWPSGSASGAVTVEADLTAGYVPTSYGGQAAYTGNKGRLLYRMSPGTNNVRRFAASSKDHIQGDTGVTTTWVVEVRKP
jgi:hypothetical protein